MARTSGPYRVVSNPNTNTGNNTNTSHNDGFICQSGNFGSISNPPTDALIIYATANSAAANIVAVTNAAFGQASTLTIPDPGAAAANFVLSTGAPTTVGLGNTLTVRVTAGQAALAAAGKVNIMVAPSGTSQFEVLGMRVIKSTGLSGNSGDRLLALTDGTVVFNNTGVTAALLGTPITTRPAGTGNPDIATSVDPLSTAGANIYVQYTGGSLDYNAGSVVLEVQLVQITA